ncbi:MAG: hypothetical protein JWO11_4019 [Nocardioides sp.]|nr:hypothetical protein [Nocardioides sp.]
MNQPDQPQVVRRPVVVRNLLALYEQPRYLEIGVCTGHTFHQVEAPYKVAVDPEFRFDPEAAARENPGSTYHQVTSDEYFGSIVGEDEQFDVVFLDGLHTVEQTLRDLTNALPHLQPRGVIVIDDVAPPTYLASLPNRTNFFEVRRHLGSTDQRWMGDVYKLVYFIDTFFQQLTYRTISNNHGQAVVWRDRRTSVTERTLNEIGSLTFEQFALEQDALHLTRFGQIVKEVRASVER